MRLSPHRGGTTPAYLILALLCTSSAWAQSSAAARNEAERLYLRGARQMESAQYVEAESSFAHAYALDPAHAEYLKASAAAQEHRITALLQQAAEARAASPARADQLIAQARAIDPENPRVRQHNATLPASATAKLSTLPRKTVPAGSIELQPAKAVHSFHLRGDTRSVLVEVAAAYGIRATLDNELTTRSFRLDIDDVDYTAAIAVVNALASTFETPLDEHSVLAAADTPTARKQYEHLVEETVPLDGYTTEQVNDVANLAKNVFDLSKVSAEPTLHAVTIRAPADTMDVINALLADLLDSGTEVLLDVKLYSVDTDRARHLGVVLPSGLSALNVRAEEQQLINQNSSLVQQLISSGVLGNNPSNDTIALALIGSGAPGTSALKGLFFVFGGGLTQTALSLGVLPTINLLLSESDAKTLEDVQLRVNDRDSATFKTGTRYPIQTSLFSDVASQTTSPLAGVSVNGTSLSALLSQYLGTSSLNSSATIPQVQYEDLGVTVTASPKVLRTGEVQLHLDVKVSALSGAALNGIPILGNRQFVSDLTVSDGQPALISSNVNRSESYAVTGLPGLSEVPGFQSVTDKATEKITGDLVLLVTPHILHRAHAEAKGPFLPLTARPEVE